MGKKENRNQITFAHNSSDGYRVQTKLRRDNASWISRMQLTAKHQLTASILFTDMEYQTPGALTLAEYNNDPKLARPAAGIFPSAVAAKAAIYQKNVLAGFTNEFIVDPKFKNTTTFYGAFAQIKNPTIRNYERRNEPHFGGRSIFTYNKKEIASQLQFLAGAEFQKGFFNTLV